MKEDEQLEIGEFKFDIASAKDQLKEMGAERALLQVPDGLRRKADKIAESLDIEISIWGGSCYGSCDLPLEIGEADVLIHVGHSEIPNLDVDYPVIYIEGRSTNFREIPDELYEILEGKIALYSSVQYLDHLETIKEKLEEKGYEVVIGEGDDRIKYPGQVLGCNYSAKVKDADSHLYIGTGDFHPLGLSMSVGKEIIKLDPLSGELGKIGDDMDRFLRKRFGLITLAEDAEKIGIIVSTKSGQRRYELAEYLKKKLPEKCTLYEFDEITPDLVDSFDWDCAVCTACPRIALDDSNNYSTVMITPDEFRIVLKEKNWERWTIDEIH
ncbi:MAG: diphthamide biosynthesis enzyme Dph2 [Thermoplasmatota archaeon]